MTFGDLLPSSDTHQAEGQQSWTASLKSALPRKAGALWERQDAVSGVIIVRTTEPESIL